ncbi:hypothetical protein OGATHE_004371 [Ogataea polymorpha]|uniref:Uncharacterized protein n=1 Tax=Ogataea polymorpha TaxID=460523 RepID=A0A9P8T2C3_9ASCO|nr:hypothetical protein OGATHE_004371 [Ogataea polymorpha]
MTNKTRTKAAWKASVIKDTWNPPKKVYIVVTTHSTTMAGVASRPVNASMAHRPKPLEYPFGKHEPFRTPSSDHRAEQREQEDRNGSRNGVHQKTVNTGNVGNLGIGGQDSTSHR